MVDVASSAIEPDYKIDDPSQELLQEVVTTFPYPDPVSFRVDMLAHGLTSHPHQEEYTDFEEKGVIPNTGLEFQVNSEGELHPPNTVFTGDNMEQYATALAEGIQHHWIGVKEDFNHAPIELLQKEFLPTYFDAGYEIDTGQFVFSGESVIEFSREEALKPESGRIAYFDPDRSDREVVDWFQSLEE